MLKRCIMVQPKRQWFQDRELVVMKVTISKKYSMRYWERTHRRFDGLYKRINKRKKKKKKIEK